MIAFIGTRKAIHLAYYIMILQVVFNISCKTPDYSTRAEYSFISKDGKPDYSDMSYWAAHPWKKDPSDSIPLPLQSNESNDSLADVFFIHPTTLVSSRDKRLNAPIDDKKLNAKTDFTSMLYQASAFNENTRIFAPRYRQTHIRAFFSNSAENDSLFALAYSDVKDAFEFYLRHYNGGRPIIIAAHSQGTKHAAQLLKDYFDAGSMQQKLICAYLIGLPVPENYFQKISACNAPDKTGCFVSWRSYKRGYTDTQFVAKEKFKAIVVNPLTWTTANDYAPRSLNTGSILKNFNKLKKGVADAQINGNVLWMAKPRFFGNFLLTTRNYHIGDINLFYNNIRQNVKQRISAYRQRRL